MRLKFGDLLSNALHDIKRHTGKKIGIIMDELGYGFEPELSGDAIESWRYRKGPPSVNYLETLAQLIINYGSPAHDRDWLRAFLESDNHPYPEAICNRIFPDGHDAQARQPSSLEPTDSFPHLSTAFFGREAEQQDICDLLLSSPRLVTLLADGGMGKTRLALQVAQTLQPSFTHGCWFVPLVAVQNTNGAIAQIAATIGLKFLDGIPASHQLRGYVKQKQLLLVLDNLEHLLTDELFDLITQLLQAAPQLKILATSRERLRLQPEHPYSLRGLASTPQNDVAKQLFVSRSAAHLDMSQNEGEVEQICRLVDGIPLALELAASLTATLSTADILRALKKDIDILQADFHDVPARHSSLKEIYDASWRTLSDAEKAIIAKFSIFRNG
ncbi:MAG: NB-ARC domain-containing protein, partial [Chloroflexota bacterium]